VDYRRVGKEGDWQQPRSLALIKRQKLSSLKDVIDSIPRRPNVYRTYKGTPRKNVVGMSVGNQKRYLQSTVTCQGKCGKIRGEYLKPIKTPQQGEGV